MLTGWPVRILQKDAPPNAWKPNLSDLYLPWVESLEQWESLPTLPAGHQSRIWCPLNLFGMPRGRYVLTKQEPESEVEPYQNNRMLCLQGAGDVLFATGLIKVIKRPVSLHTYSKFSNLVDNLSNIELYTCEPGKPTDLVARTMAHNYNWNMHYPRAARPLLFEAQQRGWDHYDWMGFINGHKIAERDKTIQINVTPRDVERAQHVLNTNMIARHGYDRPSDPGSKWVIVHPFASDPRRNTWNLFFSVAKAVSLLYAHVKFLLVGNSQEIPPSTSLIDNIIDLTGKLSYRQTAGLIGREADAVIAGDSVVLHLAAPEEVPVLGVYTHTPATWSGPGFGHIGSTRLQDPKPEDVVKWLLTQLKLRE